MARTVLFASHFHGYSLLSACLQGPLAESIEVVGVASDDPTKTYCNPSRRFWRFPHERYEETMVVDLAQRHGIETFTEKPSSPISDLANGGLYVWDRALYAEIAEMNVDDIAYDVIPSLIGRTRGYVHKGYHRDIGNIDLLLADETEEQIERARECLHLHDEGPVGSVHFHQSRHRLHSGNDLRV